MTRFIIVASPMGRPLYLRRGKWVADIERATHYQSRSSALVSLATEAVRNGWARHAEIVQRGAA